MSGPVYVVESEDTPLGVVPVGGLDAFIAKVGRGVYARCTVWYVVESGKMATVNKERHGEK